MSQNYPWFKFHHIEYLLNPAVSSLSLEAQGANTRLMAYAARQSEFGTLPTNEKQLISMSGCKSFKQWQKIFNELVSNGIWKTIGFIEDGNVRLICPMMIVESAPTQTKEQPQDDASQDDISAKRSAAAKARWDAKRASDNANYMQNNANTDFAPCKTDANDMQNNNLHDAKVMQNDANANFAYANEGGKGGDLDLNLEQDLDINQYINSHSKTRETEKKSAQNFFDDELRPNIHILNSKLGANLITEKFIEENLFSFNSHYETQQLTDNQRLAKWVNWFKREQAKQQAQTIQRPNKTQPPKNQNPVFGNVNDAFPINQDDRLLTEDEKLAIAKMLEEDEHVVF